MSNRSSRSYNQRKVKLNNKLNSTRMLSLKTKKTSFNKWKRNRHKIWRRKSWIRRIISSTQDFFRCLITLSYQRRKIENHFDKILFHLFTNLANCFNDLPLFTFFLSLSVSFSSWIGITSPNFGMSFCSYSNFFGFWSG